MQRKIFRLFLLVFPIFACLCKPCRADRAVTDTPACPFESALKADFADKYDEAIAFYRVCVASDPKDWESMNYIAGLYGKKNDGVAEVEWAKRALDVAPEEKDTLMNYGSGLSLIGDLQAAEVAFKKVEALAPKSPVPVYNQALLAEKVGDNAKAESLYRRSLAIDPTFEDANINLAALLANTRRQCEAFNLLDKYVEISPQSSDATNLEKDIEKHETISIAGWEIDKVRSSAVKKSKEGVFSLYLFKDKEDHIAVVLTFSRPEWHWKQDETVNAVLLIDGALIQNVVWDSRGRVTLIGAIDPVEALLQSMHHAKKATLQFESPGKKSVAFDISGAELPLSAALTCVARSH